MIEDEYYIADDVKRTLIAAGADVIGPVGTLEQAKEAVEKQAFDFVILDLNLHEESAIVIADRLVSEGCKFIVSTGYDITSVPDQLRDQPRIEKPFTASDLLQMIVDIETGSK